ncbi:tyrosine-type recombinase/integrase [Myxococcus sp. K38C18041901]|uniref:tyrosine-type recombinase/integrase n=1 Tax=Myxococcus guangdongensis TaxID=2906760 RepID=UPI0020A80263|nr:tyrosine-type recombinase/integrase [Myxococcus guangdongensis]MCP3060987.1 tyrosine-type recombinase/integrase [Myxococcus guangdongensis]
MASVRKIGKKWYATWKYADGKAREKVTPARTKAEAMLLANEKELNAWKDAQGITASPVEITLQEAYDTQFKAVVLSHASGDTINGRWQNHILPELGAKLIHIIRPADISVLLRSKLRDDEDNNDDADGEEDEEGLAPQTVKAIRSHLQAFFTWAKKEAQIFSGENPAALSWDPELPEPEPRVLDLSEAEVIARHSTNQDIEDFILVGLYTGMRRGEIIGCPKKNVHLEDRTLLLSRSGSRKRTKTKRIRQVPIPLALVPVLARRLADPQSEWLFWGRDGKRLKKDYKICSRFRTAMKRAGIVEGYRFTCTAPKTRAPGERNGRAKLTADQVADLRKRAAAGTTQAELSRQFGVAARTVGMIVRGELWGRGTNKHGGCGFSALHPDEAPRNCPTCAAPMKVEVVPADHIFKDLRASYLTHVVERTGDVKVTRDLGGHTGERTTMRHYLARRMAHLKAKVDEAFAGMGASDSSSGPFPIGNGEEVPVAVRSWSQPAYEGGTVLVTANSYGNWAGSYQVGGRPSKSGVAGSSPAWGAMLAGVSVVIWALNWPGFPR